MELTSRANPIVKHMRALGANAAYRAQHGEFVCDGGKLLKEALCSGTQIKTLFYGSGLDAQLLREAKAAGARCFSLPDNLLCHAANLKTLSDTVFSVKMRQLSPKKRGFCLMLDRLSDPGNVGTILRIADAFDLPAVFLAGKCADPFSPKVVRASMGAIFRVPVIRCSPSDAKSAAAELGCTLAAAVLSPCALPPERVKLENVCAIIGNESAGVCEVLRALCDAEIYIPMPGRAESLNAAVAAGILAYAASVQKRT